MTRAEYHLEASEPHKASASLALARRQIQDEAPPDTASVARADASAAKIPKRIPNHEPFTPPPNIGIDPSTGRPLPDVDFQALIERGHQTIPSSIREMATRAAHNVLLSNVHTLVARSGHTSLGASAINSSSAARGRCAVTAQHRVRLTSPATPPRL